jgi:hypothetical protein
MNELINDLTLPEAAGIAKSFQHLLGQTIRSVWARGTDCPSLYNSRPLSLFFGYAGQDVVPRQFSTIPASVVSSILKVVVAPILIKKKRKFSSYIRKFRVQQLQSHI